MNGKNRNKSKYYFLFNLSLYYDILLMKKRRKTEEKTVRTLKIMKIMRKKRK
jgi:hypothetical protein